MNNHKWLKEDELFVKDFKFDDFLEAVEFVNHVASIAESEKHHPNILIHSYNHVRISLTTHEVNDVTEKDIELSRMIDNIY